MFRDKYDFVGARRKEEHLKGRIGIFLEENRKMREIIKKFSMGMPLSTEESAFVEKIKSSNENTLEE